MANTERFRMRDFRRRVVAGSFPQYASLAEAIREMQFVQADPIRSPARAQDLILRQRVDGYAAGDLEQRFPKLRAEEGYLFAYGFMTPAVWQRLTYRPQAKLKKIEREVLDSVAEIGEAHPRALADRFGRKSVKNPWGGSSQETKRILEKLHHHGHLRVSRRESGVRVYQVPKQSAVEPEESLDRYRLLALTTAQVFGPTTIPFLVSELRNHNHLLPNRADRVAAIKSLIEENVLTEIDLEGVTYLATRKALVTDNVQSRVRILAPFDPLVRDRERFEQLWGWSYRFEAYVPAAKRERGYYAMPVLWKDQIIGWSNATVVKNQLEVEFGYTGKRPTTKIFRQCAEDEVRAIAIFLGLDDEAWKLTL